MARRKNYIEALDIARCLAILGVVFIHSDSLFLSDYANPDLRTMLFVSRFAVPLFIMISGYLHKDRSDTDSRLAHYKKFVISRFKRIIIPYFALSTFYMAVRIFIEKVSFFNSFVSIKYDSLESILAAIFLVRENPAGHLYFLPLLFFVVVLFCFISEIIKNCHLLTLACIALSILTYATAGNIYLSLNPLKGIGFYASGYFVRKCLHEKAAVHAILQLFVLSLLSYLSIIIFNGEIRSLNSFYRFTTLFFYHLAGAFFTLQLSFYAVQVTSFRRLNSAMKFIGKYSYPIFLWHEPYIISVLYILLKKISVNQPFWNQSTLILIGISIPIIWHIYFLMPAKTLIHNFTIRKTTI